MFLLLPLWLHFTLDLNVFTMFLPKPSANALCQPRRGRLPFLVRRRPRQQLPRVQKPQGQTEDVSSLHRVHTMPRNY